MKPSAIGILGAILVCPAIASAIIALPPLDERVRDAEVIAVGTIKRTAGDENWLTGHFVVERVLKGNAKPGDKIPVRWKSPPAKQADDPNRPRLPDYTFRPAVGSRLIGLLPSRKDKKNPHTLTWGSTERVESEGKIQAALKGK